jgi:CBS domain-containing protein
MSIAAYFIKAWQGGIEACNSGGCFVAYSHRIMSMPMRRETGSWQGRRGLVLVEFAIILALIVLSAAAAMLLVGGESAHTFARLHDAGEKQPRATSAVAQTATTADFSAENRVATAAVKEEAHAVTLDQRALTALLGGIAIVGYVAVRRVQRRPRALAGLDEAREFLERLDDKRFVKRQDIFKVLSADPEALLENRLEVRHIMSSRLRNVRPKTPIHEIKEIMAEEIVRHFPVVNEKGTIVGIVSDRDLFTPDARVAADVMTRSVVTVSPKAKLETAAAQLINRNISCLPVMENSALVGIVTTTDLVMTLQCAFQLRRRQSRPAENGSCAVEASYQGAAGLAAANA